MDKAVSEDSKATSPVAADGRAASSGDAPTSTKRQLRKIIREDSSWSPRGIIIASLTGVSVAAISTQLTGLLGSTVLIAVMAMVSATVSEIYRIFLALTGLGAKKAAERATARLPGEPSNGSAKDRQRRNELESDPITEAMDTITNAYRMPEGVPQKKSIFGRFFQRLAGYGRANPFFWTVLVFVALAGSTIAIVYSISDGEPPQIINRTVTVEEALTPGEKQAIVNRAEEQLMAELQERIASAVSSEAANQATELSELQEKISELIQRMDALEAPLDSPSPTLPPSESDDPTRELAELREQLEALQTSYDELNARLDALEAEPLVDPTSRPATEPSSTASNSQS